MIVERIARSIAAVFLFTIFTGILFPLAVWILAQVLFPYQANGSLMSLENGRYIGSEVIGQRFSRAEYFHTRPSSAGNGYDAANSSGSNLGPTSAKLISGLEDDESTEADESFAGIHQLVQKYREINSLAPGISVPADAVTRSGSGLDPHISPDNAGLQTPRVAKARRLSESEVKTLVSLATEGKFLGIFGEPRVNVLKLNLSLDRVSNIVRHE